MWESNSSDFSKWPTHYVKRTCTMRAQELRPFSSDTRRASYIPRGYTSEKVRVDGRNPGACTAESITDSSSTAVVLDSFHACWTSENHSDQVWAASNCYHTTAVAITSARVTIVIRIIVSKLLKRSETSGMEECRTGRPRHRKTAFERKKN